MNNVTKLPNVPKSPSDLIHELLPSIEGATSFAIVIRNQDGTRNTYWSNQPLDQLLYSASELMFDVNKACFGGDK